MSFAIIAAGIFQQRFSKVSTPGSKPFGKVGGCLGDERRASFLLLISVLMKERSCILMRGAADKGLNSH